MSMIRDDEAKVGELLHSTPLQPGEYGLATSDTDPVADFTVIEKGY